MKLGCIVVLSVALSLASGTAPARAATATWSVSATINHVDDFLSPLFALGDSVSGTLIVEEQKSPCRLGLCPAIAHYNQVVDAAELNVGDRRFSGQAPTLSSDAWVRFGGRGDDTDGLQFFLGFTNEESETASFRVDEVSVYFEYSAGSALESADFPLTPPQAELFGVTSLQILFGRQTLRENGVIVIETFRATADDLRLARLSAVPLPPASTLFAGALLMMGQRMLARKRFPGV